VYASYIVKFVYYFLRIIINKERIKAQLYSNTDSDSNSNSNSDSVFTVSNANSLGSNRPRSNADSDSPYYRRKETDLIKDARELFY
jgi:hypothetical protein